MLPLKEHLGEATKIIDMIVDQAPDGIEVLRGASTYTFDGNWKLQAENGADGYHVSAVHWNYAATTSAPQRRRQGRHRQGDERRRVGQAGRRLVLVQERPHAAVDELVESGGPAAVCQARRNGSRSSARRKADWMLRKSRNLCLYPNVYLMDQFSSQIRVVRPISVNKSEATIYCIAPKGEPPEARERRLRQYEDFFNATGMATPDDLEEFRSCQQGYEARAVKWNDMCRGAVHWVTGPDENANLIGLQARS